MINMKYINQQALLERLIEITKRFKDTFDNEVFNVTYFPNDNSFYCSVYDNANKYKNEEPQKLYLTKRDLAKFKKFYKQGCYVPFVCHAFIVEVFIKIFSECYNGLIEIGELRAKNNFRYYNYPALILVPEKAFFE